MEAVSKSGAAQVDLDAPAPQHVRRLLRIDSLDRGLDVVAHAAHVDCRLGRNAESGGRAGRVGQSGDVDKGLARNAAGPGAVATDTTLFDKSDLRPDIGAKLSGRHSR